MMDKPAGKDPVNQRIAARVKALRAARGLSLAALAEASGVSRSAISLVERAETSATAVVLEKLAAALGVSLASLFEASRDAAAASPVSRRKDQAVWRDPASGYGRRNVSPGAPSPIQIVEIAFPPRAQVAYDSAGRVPPLHHQVWVLDGAIEVQVGDERHALAKGDCLAFVLDRPTTYRNRTGKPARYIVVIAQGVIAQGVVAQSVIAPGTRGPGGGAGGAR